MIGCYRCQLTRRLGALFLIFGIQHDTSPKPSPEKLDATQDNDMRKMDARLDVDKPNWEYQSPVSGSTCAAPGRFASSNPAIFSPHRVLNRIHSKPSKFTTAHLDTGADANFEGS